MANLATVLKEEIRRLARKEVRVQTASVKRTATAHRRDIAHLKRRINSNEKRVEQFVRRFAKPPESAGGEAVTVANRFSARSVHAQRRRLKLSAAEYGKLAGVSGQTIYQWEHGKSRPRRSQLATLVSLRSIGRREALAQLTQSSAKKSKRSAGGKRQRQRARQ